MLAVVLFGLLSVLFPQKIILKRRNMSDYSVTVMSLLSALIITLPSSAKHLLY